MGTRALPSLQDITDTQKKNIVMFYALRKFLLDNYCCFVKFIDFLENLSCAVWHDHCLIVRLVACKQSNS